MLLMCPTPQTSAGLTLSTAGCAGVSKERDVAAWLWDVMDRLQLASELRSPWQQDGSVWKEPFWRVSSGLRLQQTLWLKGTLAYF